MSNKHHNAPEMDVFSPQEKASLELAHQSWAAIKKTFNHWMVGSDVEASEIISYALACRRNDRTGEFPFRDRTTSALMPTTPQATPWPP